MNPTVWDYLFVVPDAYLRIFDLPYQMDMFNLYHRRSLTRLVHSIFSVLSLFGWFLLLSYLNAGFALLCLLSVWYLRMDLKAGLQTLPLILGMWIAAGYVHAATGGTTFRLALIFMAGSSFLQSLSHAVEDVPPPLSNRGDQWAPVKEFVKEAGMSKKILLLVWGTFLEVITAPRLVPVVVSVYGPLRLSQHNRPTS